MGKVNWGVRISAFGGQGGGRSNLLVATNALSRSVPTSLRSSGLEPSEERLSKQMADSDESTRETRRIRWPVIRGALLRGNTY